MRLRLLVLSSIFPSPANPTRGPMIDARLHHLVKDADIEARVIAPVPWFPWRAPVFGRYARFAATPHEGVAACGAPVAYPRYPMLPRVGIALQPHSLMAAAHRVLQRWQAQGWEPDLIDSHYFYPDGVAAVMLGRRAGLPVVVTARGTDINVLARQPRTAARIAWAAREAQALIALSPGLAEGIVALGVERSKVTVLRNGVDLERFGPEDRAASALRLGLPLGPRLACVGNLLPVKAQELAVQALVHLPGHHLVIVGDGPQRRSLVALGRRLGVEHRLSFMPGMPQAELRHLYSAVDAMLLTSHQEGWPNVVLESLACGTPVVSTDVGAVSQMLTDPGVGRVVQGRDPAHFAREVAGLLATRASPEAIRRHAEGFDWSAVSRGQLEVFARALRAGAHRPAPLPATAAAPRARH